MKPYEFQRIYHPQLGRFVYRHKGSGIIVDNIFKPFKWIGRKLTGKVAKKAGKQLIKKAVDSAATSAGDKLGKTIVDKSVNLLSKKSAKKEKSGDLIQRKLGNVKSQQPTNQEETDAILDRLIQGSGKKRVKFM